MPKILSKTNGHGRFTIFSLSTLLVLSLLCGQTHAQCVTYDLNPKGDTINCVDKDKHKQGPWSSQMPPLRGEPGYIAEGYYKDDQKVGEWHLFTSQGDLTAVENYKWGFKDGVQRYYTPQGDLMREESWKSVNPEHPYDTVPVYDLNSSGTYKLTVVKLEGNTVKDGTWKYYDPSTGMVAKTEKYQAGQLQSDSEAERPAPKQVEKPKEVQDFEKKNSGKKKITTRNGQTGG